LILENSLPLVSYPTTWGKKKRVLFNSTPEIIRIPSRDECVEVGSANMIWYTSEELHSIEKEVYREVEDYILECTANGDVSRLERFLSRGKISMSTLLLIISDS
jgi:hypothetical protein